MPESVRVQAGFAYQRMHPTNFSQKLFVRGHWPDRFALRPFSQFVETASARLTLRTHDIAPCLPSTGSGKPGGSRQEWNDVRRNHR